MPLGFVVGHKHELFKTGRIIKLLAHIECDVDPSAMSFFSTTAIEINVESRNVFNLNLESCI